MFAAHRQRQYPGELLFSTVVELMTLVSLGLSPSLYAAATTAQHLPMSLAALYVRPLHHATIIHIGSSSYRLREHADLLPEHLRNRPVFA